MIEQANGTLRRLRSFETIFYLLFSIALNSLANGLTIATNLGSAVWTASAVNLKDQLSWSLGTILFVYAILVQLVNILIRRRFLGKLVVSNLLFAFLFSYLVQFWHQIFLRLGVTNLPLGWRLVLDLVGIVLIATGVSIYQRVNVMLHPNDELSYLLRFRFFHGNATVGQIVSYVTPVTIMLYCLWRAKTLYAVGLGTVFAIVCQGGLTGWADKHIFKRLHHRRVKSS
ncbi:YczE/YyaS/YitT family protein [Bombilactobacillus thymidiniphilus]|uniref:Sugar specific permease n=1 Tax=Bombilactobacillus thymidiniphilus TaxID=2923363 RepID=A0ABY4PBV9_9LACO|nr:hypothetical protein [Bombilactobacillus thymidiniphilus]UQS83153.1 hypothetical protein MOO47_05035 [Bombilactobacillus thymidiniphilus]